MEPLSLEITQHPAGQCPEQPALVYPALSWGLDWTGSTTSAVLCENFTLVLPLSEIAEELPPLEGKTKTNYLRTETGQ